MIFAKLLSRKFLLALCGSVVVLLKGLGVLNLDDESLWQMVTLILGWIGVEGAADVVRHWRTLSVEVDDTLLEKISEPDADDQQGGP